MRTVEISIENQLRSIKMSIVTCMDNVKYEYETLQASSIKKKTEKKGISKTMLAKGNSSLITYSVLRCALFIVSSEINRIQATKEE